MIEANKETLDKIATEFEEAGLPVPLVTKGKIPPRDQLLLHIFMDHLYIGIYQQLKTAITELENLPKQDDNLVNDLIEAFETYSLDIEGLFDHYAEEVEIIPSFTELQKFVKVLETEMKAALAITKENLEKNE